MQIYEITRRKRTDEGVLGAIGKSLANKFVSSTLPGVTAFDNDPITPAPTTAPTTSVATTAPTAPTAPTQPSWVGTNVNVPAVQRKQAAQATPAPAQTTPAVQLKTVATTPTASTSTGIVPQAGHRIAVLAANGGKYYKTDKGWTNELGQAVTNAGSIATLEKLADTAGREEKIPTAKPVRPVRRPVAKRKRR